MPDKDKRKKHILCSKCFEEKHGYIPPPIVQKTLAECEKCGTWGWNYIYVEEVYKR